MNKKITKDDVNKAILKYKKIHPDVSPETSDYHQLLMKLKI